MSDSVRPHRWQPTRLPRPWDSPGKNTGVGCHFLLQCMKVKNGSEVAQSCLTLSNPLNCSPPGSSVHEIFQARVLEWGAIAFSKRYQIQGINGKLKRFLKGHRQILTFRMQCPYNQPGLKSSNHDSTCSKNEESEQVQASS